ncbi:MAG: FAD-dependent oxidoreductase [Desulfosudaceae bacterium]
MPNKLIIIGGVAGGATAAARARRLDEATEIILFERGQYISFANCGLPYYLGGAIEERDELLVTTPADLSRRYRVDVRTQCEVVSIDRQNREVTVKDLSTDTVYLERFDKLILSPGAAPVQPSLEGINLENIFTVRTIPDIDCIKQYVDEQRPQSAVIVGGGFIGLEMAENLVHRKVKVTLVEMLDQVMAPLDVEMARMVQAHLAEKGVQLNLGDGIKRFTKETGRLQVVTEKGNRFACDLIILAIGVRPENRLALSAGLDINEQGGIVTDTAMATSDPDIYAVGDAAQVSHRVSGKPAMIPLAGPANRQGRIAADNVQGRSSAYPGTLGTAIVKIFDRVVAGTGLNEKTAAQQKISCQKSYTCSGSHASYYPGSTAMTIKLLFTPDEGKILGAQIVGQEGVDKRIDVIATAICGQMTVYDLEQLELAYAPPFSSAKDPVNMAGFVAANHLKGDVESVYWDDVPGFSPETHALIDLRGQDEIDEEGAIPGAQHIPVNDLRDRLDELDKDKLQVLFCAVGLRGYIAYRILRQYGYRAVNFSGGFELYRHSCQSTKKETSK